MNTSYFGGHIFIDLLFGGGGGEQGCNNATLCSTGESFFNNSLETWFIYRTIHCIFHCMY